MVTRKEVAEKAGVSVSVVSRAMNNSGYVEAEKKKRILEVADKLGYYPHPVAEALQKRRTKQLLFSVRICGIPFISICIREWWKPQGSGII